ncbi:hypothetical protein ACLESD_38540 [Pyxidicoccus sp. 3LFB2]
MGAQVFRTDVAGEVQVVGDGKTLVITPQRLPEGVPDDTRYTFAGLSAASVPAAATPVAKAGDVSKAAATQAPQGPRGTPSAKAYGDSKAYGEVVDIDDLPAADAPPRSRTEPRPTRGMEPRGMSAGPYVASSKSDVFHLPSCRNAKKIKSYNKLVFKTREEASRDNRRPARDCNP